MIIYRGLGDIGTWTYILKDREEKLRPGWCDRTAERICEVAAIAARARLMVPPFSLRAVPPARGGADVVDTAGDSSTLAAWLVRHLVDDGQRWPWIEVSGAGEVDLPNGGVLQGEGVVELAVSALQPWTAVHVSTRCDAWLAFDLQAQAQPMLAKLNAPRLSAVLADIEQLLGVSGEGEYTRFAQCEGYTLRNQGDEDDPADLEDLGYTEEFVRES